MTIKKDIKTNCTSQCNTGDSRGGSPVLPEHLAAGAEAGLSCGLTGLRRGKRGRPLPNNENPSPLKRRTVGVPRETGSGMDLNTRTGYHKKVSKGASCGILSTASESDKYSDGIIRVKTSREKSPRSSASRNWTKALKAALQTETWGKPMPPAPDATAHVGSSKPLEASSYTNREEVIRILIPILNVACSLCDTQVNSLKKLVKHYKMFHMSIKCVFSCKKC